MLTLDERRLLEFELANRLDGPAKEAGIRIHFAMTASYYRYQLTRLLERTEVRAAYPTLG